MPRRGQGTAGVALGTGPGKGSGVAERGRPSSMLSGEGGGGRSSAELCPGLILAQGDKGGEAHGGA